MKIREMFNRKEKGILCLEFNMKYIVYAVTEAENKHFVGSFTTFDDARAYAVDTQDGQWYIEMVKANNNYLLK